MTVHHTERSRHRDEPSLRFGQLELVPGEGLALAAGIGLHLSVREFGLLVELALNDGRVVRREELYQAVWREPLRLGDRTVDVYVRRLRVKLAQGLPAWSFIHTHVGFGYRFAPMLESDGDAARLAL